MKKQEIHKVRRLNDDIYYCEDCKYTMNVTYKNLTHKEFFKK